MLSLKKVLADVESRRVAIGHFNISDLAAMKGILEAATELKVPVMIGVSEGEREFLGVKTTAALVKSLREECAWPIFLNADHTHSLLKAREAAEAGFDEILFDGSKLPFEENLKQTKEAVSAIKSINPEILVEGEIGYIGSSSAVLDAIPEGASLDEKNLTTPEEAVRFIAETGIDILAPAVGNMHGLLKSMVSGETFKRLNIERIKAIKEATGKFLTLHGGSGTLDEDFTKAIDSGVTIIHINTEIRLAWRRGLEKGLAENPNEIAPYKILPLAVSAVKEIVLNRLKLFNKL